MNINEFLKLPRIFQPSWPIINLSVSPVELGVICIGRTIWDANIIFVTGAASEQKNGLNITRTFAMDHTRTISTSQMV